MVQESVGWGAWTKLSKYMGAVATTLRTHTAWSGAGDTDGAACSGSKAPAQQGGLGVRFASAKSSSSDATAENLAAAADRATPRTTCSLSPSGSSGAEEEFGSDYGGEEGEQDCSGFGYTPNSDLKPCTPRTIVRSCIKKAEREANTQSWFDYYGTVGQGSFGMVELVHQRHKQASECTGGTTFAVKVCRKGTTRRQLEICRREARIMKSIPPHPFVVGLSHCVEDDGNIYMALEYCMGGDLFTHLGELGTLPERAARHLVAELTLALAHLHADGIMHRDVKPENVLLDARGHARLADFGLATSNITRADGGAMSICGSPGYIAPEVLAGRGYGLAADWWQLGMLLLEVTTGQLPWAGATLGDVSRAFRSVPLDLPAYLSSDATDFLILALCPHPGMRIGSLGADEVKRHAFFSGVRWGRVARKEVPPPFNPSSPSYHGGPFTPCCGHGAEAAQAHAAGEAPRCRVEVSHDEDGAIVMETVPVPQAAEGAAPPRPAGAAAELCEGVGRERGSSARSGGAGGSLRGGSGRARGSGRVWFQ